MSKKAVEWKGKIAIQFPFDYGTLSKVKSLPNRKYHAKGRVKFWTCPITTASILELKEWGFQLDENLASYVTVDSPITKRRISSIEVPSYKKDPYPFQVEGVGFIEYKNGRVLLADEMGLGKTVQVLMWLELHPNKRIAVIVCPASLKLNWAREIEEGMTTNMNIHIAEGRDPYFIPNTDIIIINYDILSYWSGMLLELEPQVLITDECHYYKNNKAKRTKAVKRLAKKIPHVIAISGTPIQNRPIEIYNAVTILDPTLFPNYWNFVQRYCDAKNTGFGWDLSGASNTEELHEILINSIMIRRKKKDVLADLPDKVRSYIPFDIDNRKEYDKAGDDFIKYAKSVRGEEAAEKASNAEIITQIEYLKQIAVKGKLEEVLDWISNFLESGEKLVVFATHKEVITKIMDKFKKIAVKVDGSVTGRKRDQAVVDFQTLERIRLFVGNIKAAGVGLTLTAASNVAVIELPWAPGDLDQLEDRCHRIGQKDCVNVHYLLSLGTIEYELAEILDRKRKILDSVLDGQATGEESLLTELINKTLRR